LKASVVCWPGKTVKRIREEQLANGLLITFTDQSNRYFGDYHRVLVVASIVCNLQDLPSSTPDQEQFRQRALVMLGERLTVVKRFERMGVPSSEVENIRGMLVNDFLGHAFKYLARPDYPRAMAAAEMKKHRSPSFYG
jgi:hypothetical protein